MGLPSVGIMTEKFVSAAELMAKVLGADGHRFVTIEHPISSASRTELAERAARCAGEVVALLTTEQGSSPAHVPHA